MACSESGVLPLESEDIEFSDVLLFSISHASIPWFCNEHSMNCNHSSHVQDSERDLCLFVGVFNLDVRSPEALGTWRAAVFFQQ